MNLEKKGWIVSEDRFRKKQKGDLKKKMKIVERKLIF